MDTPCKFGHKFFALDLQQVEHPGTVECYVPIVCTVCGELKLKKFELPKTRKEN